MTVQRRNSAGLAIVISLLALMLFDLMGLIIKLLSSDYRAAELSAYRNLFGLIPSLIALASSRAWHASGRKLIIRQWPLACLRGLLVSGAQFLFYLSLGRLAFATASTLTYSNALFMTALAVPFLGEKVGPLRWSAVLIGFVGVLWITGLGSDTFSWDALIPIGAAMLYALAGVSSRLTDEDVPSPVINLYSTVFAVVGSLILALSTGGFSPLATPSDIWWIAGMGGFGGCAVLLLIVSYRMTEQSNLAPFSYFGIPMAFFFGWLFFGEAPVADLFPGAILIAAGGLMVIWRERRLKSSD